MSAEQTEFTETLLKLGVPQAYIPEDVTYLERWAQREGVPQGIDPYNYLGTTLTEPGSWQTNSAGVQGYADVGTATAALASELGQSNFAPIKAQLVAGHPFAAGVNESSLLSKAYIAWSGGGYSFPVSPIETGPVTPVPNPPTTSQTGASSTPLPGGGASTTPASSSPSSTQTTTESLSGLLKEMVLRGSEILIGAVLAYLALRSLMGMMRA